MVAKQFKHWRGLAILLVGGMLLGLILAESASSARDDAKAEELPPDLAKIPSDSLVLMSVRVADLWESAVVRAVREKMAKDVGEGARAFEQYFGLPLDQVERLTMVVVDPFGGGGDQTLLFLRTNKPYERKKLLATLGGEPKEVKYKERSIFVGEKNRAIVPLDERSFVLSDSTRDNVLRAWLDRAPPKTEGHLAAALRLAAGKHTLVVGGNVKAFNDAVGNKLPGEAEPFKPLLQALSGTFTLDLTELRGRTIARGDLRVNFATEQDAADAERPFTTGLDLGRTTLGQGIDQLAKQKETSKIVQFLTLARTALNDTKARQEGKMLRASASLTLDTATAGIMAIEAIQQMREAAAQAQSSNNLKQIALAMHNYHDTYGHLPAQATFDKNGKPMLSWRVMILPFVEQQNLYNQFHLDEPWDSEHNKKLLVHMPKLYASPSDENTSKDHTTHYQGFVGKGAFFEGKKEPSTDFTDGTSNTLMIVEATKAVAWTQPEDLPYDAAKPLPKLGLPGAKAFQASLCDGSVRMISHSITEKTLRDAITRNDGNPLGADF